MAGRPISARKSARGRKRQGRSRSARAGAARIGDSVDGERRLFGLKRARAKLGGIGLARRRRDRARAALRAAGARGGASPANGSSGASRAIARQRSTRTPSASSDRSDDATVAERWPTNSRSPISSPSERLTLSSSPSRTCDPRRAVVDIECVGGARSGGDAALDERFGDVAGLFWGCMRRAP